tara:strand:- start:646 stop:1149 length:504 start_codon:yes stop_codon:yes gene_type:complete
MDNTSNNTSKWLTKYDKAFNNTREQYIFKTHVTSFPNGKSCIEGFIKYGSLIRDNVIINNNSIVLNNVDEIKSNLYVLLSCILRYSEVVLSKTHEYTYIKCRNLFEQKNSDYGDAFIDYKSIGILMRLNDKIRRLESLLQKKNANFESIEDTILDSFNYVILALILL